MEGRGKQKNSQEALSAIDPGGMKKKDEVPLKLCKSMGKQDGLPKFNVYATLHSIIK